MDFSTDIMPAKRWARANITDVIFDIFVATTAAVPVFGVTALIIQDSYWWIILYVFCAGLQIMGGACVGYNLCLLRCLRDEQQEMTV